MLTSWLVDVMVDLYGVSLSLSCEGNDGVDEMNSS